MENHQSIEGSWHSYCVRWTYSWLTFNQAPTTPANVQEDNKHNRINSKEEEDANKVVVCEYAKVWGPSVRKASAWVRLSTSVSLLTTTTQSATCAPQFTMSSTGIAHSSATRCTLHCSALQCHCLPQCTVLAILSISCTEVFRVQSTVKVAE